LLFDPQTSGGLLLGVPREQLDTFAARAEEMGQATWMVGSVETGTGIEVN
jgi:selenide,water dikinase